MNVLITFNLEEEVTPRIFAEKVARCLYSHGVLSDDETITVGPFTISCDKEKSQSWEDFTKHLMAQR